MTAGKRITYGKSPRQYVEVYPGSGQRGSGTRSPLLIYCHGGGWYSGSTSDHEDLAEYISSHSNIAIALLEYRITLKDEKDNEVRHPDHINDVYRGLDLLFEPTNSAEFNYDTSQIVFAGHSVGGWVVLSAALASDVDQSKAGGPVDDIPPLRASIRKSIRAFVAVESIFSVTGLIKHYPTYTSFIVPAFFSSKLQASPPYVSLEKAGVESWPVAKSGSYSTGDKPKVYVIHSSEDTLLDAKYNAQGVELLQQKGLYLEVDLTSFKGDHDDLQHTQEFWERLIEIVQVDTAS